ncbi:24198_t:CDS:2, partial [Gigaspora margarita]
DTTKPIKEITEVKLQMTMKLRPRNQQAHIRETPESDGMKLTKKSTMKPTENDGITPTKTSTTKNDYSKKRRVASRQRKLTLVTTPITTKPKAPPEQRLKKKEELVSQIRNAIEQKAKTPRSPLKSTADSITPTKTDSSNDTNNDETKNSYPKKKRRNY